MRGSPLREFFLVLLAGGLLLLPLARLTRSPVRTWGQEILPEVHADQVEAWIALRFSHAPERFTLRQADRVLLEGGGSAREDDDVLITLTDGHLRLQLNVEWPEDIPDAYAELSVEPEQFSEQRQGFWARGMVTRFLEFTWTAPSP